MTPVYSVYLLICPLTDRIRYVGQTNNIQLRFVQHLSYKGHNLELNAWVANLALKGYVPICKTIITVSTPKDARMWEQYYITQYMDAEPLCNIA
jgi:hypothetical protein